jgi:hypothetical protein
VAIKMVMENGFHELSIEDTQEIYEFGVENAERFRDFSIRTMYLIAQFKTNDNWRKLVKHSMFR